MRLKDADRVLHHGDILTLGDEKIEVISVPGHSQGSICLLGDGLMITGDTLFANGVGRCDLYGGDPAQLKKSLKALESYDENITIYPGHGQSSKLGIELQKALRF